jgi:riboflavin synthase
VFDLNIVPHTLAETTLGEFRTGRELNLELERLLQGTAAASEGSGITPAFLASHGFIK